MSWIPHDVRGDENAVKLTGPVGARLAIQFYGTAAGWDDCTWAGEVKSSVDGAVVTSFTFVEACTSSIFDLTIIIEDTSVFAPGCLYYWDVWAVTGDAAPASPLQGTIVAEASITDISPPPAVTGLIESTGLIAGGETVLITGSHFTGATAVNFGATPGTSLSVLSDTLISVVAPAHAAGVVAVTVVTPDGTSLSGATSQYTYTV